MFNLLNVHSARHPIGAHHHHTILLTESLKVGRAVDAAQFLVIRNADQILLCKEIADGLDTGCIVGKDQDFAADA